MFLCIGTFRNSCAKIFLMGSKTVSQSQNTIPRRRDATLLKLSGTKTSSRHCWQHQQNTVQTAADEWARRNFHKGAWRDQAARASPSSSAAGRKTTALPYLRVWLSGEHKAWLIKPIRTHQSSNSHTILQSVADLMRGTHPMDQSKHSHQGHSSSQAFSE